MIDIKILFHLYFIFPFLLYLSFPTLLNGEEGKEIKSINLLEGEKNELKSLEDEWNRVVFELRHEGNADKLRELSKRERSLRMKMDELKIDMRKKVIDNLERKKRDIENKLKEAREEGNRREQERKFLAEIEELNKKIVEYRRQIEVISERLEAEKNRQE